MPEEKKPNTKSKKQSTDNFDDDFEKIETIFPPIFYPEKVDGVLVFTISGLKDGPKGQLITCKLINNTAGVFKRSDEEVELEDNIFALGVTPTLTGDDKLIMKTGEKGLTALGDALVELDLPVKLIYKGKKKSSQNRGHAYHVFEFYAHKKALAAANF